MYLRVVVEALLFAPLAAAACTRESLRNVTDHYLAAQAKGSSSDLASLTTSNLTYTENEVKMTLDRSVLTEPIIIDHNRSIFDTVQCATFTEIIAATNIHQYVIGTRIEINSDNKISKMESAVTDRGDWAFNATGYKYWDSLENWDPICRGSVFTEGAVWLRHYTIPTEKQDSREVIQAAGDAYFDRFKNESVVVPFGVPCSRLEGGASTAPLNLTGDSCTAAGLPSTLVVTNRRYVVDQEMGTVDIFLGFPGLDRSQGMDTMPDSHVFRVESGKIRYIHTVSSCVEAGCGLNGVGPPQRIRWSPASWRPRVPLRFDMTAKRVSGRH